MRASLIIRLCRVLGLVSVAAVSVSGCNALRTGGLGYEDDPKAVQWKRVPVDTAVVSFAVRNPPQMLVARERRQGELGMEYEMILSNSTALQGENRIMAQVLYPVQRSLQIAPDRKQPNIIQVISSKKLKDIEVLEFPDLTIKLSETSRRNIYGPYGYMTAREPMTGAACVYAWQMVKGGKRFPDIEEMSLQFRFCDQSLSSGQILNFFDHIIVHTLSPALYGATPDRDVLIEMLRRRAVRTTPVMDAPQTGVPRTGPTGRASSLTWE